MEGWAGDSWYSSKTYSSPTKAPTKPVDPIETASDDTLILELIKRGYAVAKMSPEQLAKEV